MLINIEGVLNLLNKMAPFNTAESWDNCGLLVGDGQKKVEKILVSMDVTNAVIDDAKSKGCQLILSHHPIMFKRLNKVVATDYDGRLIMRMIESSIAHIAFHTNWDKAVGGINDALAHLFGITGLRTLLPEDANGKKLVIFVPEGYEQKVEQAVFAAGAGVIGDYSACGFSSEGQGSFMPSASATPFIGKKDSFTRVHETRLEVRVKSALLVDVIKAVYASHPYEEPAFDVYSIEGKGSVGLGRIGSLAKECALHELCQEAAEKLHTRVDIIGEKDKKIKKLAVFGGAADENALLAAKMQDADALICGETKYHTKLLAQDLGLCLIDGGHYATEYPGMIKLSQGLQEGLHELKYNTDVILTTAKNMFYSLE